MDKYCIMQGLITFKTVRGDKVWAQSQVNPVWVK